MTIGAESEIERLREALDAIRNLWRNPAPAQRQDVAFQQAVGIASAALDECDKCGARQP